MLPMILINDGTASHIQASTWAQTVDLHLQYDYDLEIDSIWHNPHTRQLIVALYDRIEDWTYIVEGILGEDNSIILYDVPISDIGSG